MSSEEKPSKTDALIIQRLQGIFPEAKSIKPQFIFLSPAQKKRVQNLAGFEPDTRMFRVFRIFDGEGQSLADAFLDTHILRTHYETILVVIRPGGVVHEIQILGFEEPPDYYPPERWLNLMKGKSLKDDLMVGRAIPNMTGATITATTIVRRVRLLLAVWKVVYGETL